MLIIIFFFFFFLQFLIISRFSLNHEFAFGKFLRLCLLNTFYEPNTTLEKENNFKKFEENKMKIIKNSFFF